MLAALGYFVFALSTAPYQEWRRASAQRWASNARLGRRPAYQYLGPGEDSLTLSGVLAPELTGGPASLEALRLMAESGKAWTLIDATGQVLGLWFIESVEETRSHFLPGGSARRIAFSLQLKRADDERIELLGDLALPGLLEALR